MAPVEEGEGREREGEEGERGGGSERVIEVREKVEEKQIRSLSVYSHRKCFMILRHLG